MSTNCVPGYDAPDSDSRNDELHVGCWAEHKDGSLLFVKGVEDNINRVIYSLYDMSQEPIMDFTDSMPAKDFKEFFSFNSTKNKKIKGNKWTWHDKTPFPWNKVIKAGARDGANFASATDLISQANRVAKALQLVGNQFDKENLPKDIDKRQFNKIIKKFKNILDGWN